jgi:hypothetical protein
MTNPTILTVDDDPLALAAITRDLASRYGGDYHRLPTGRHRAQGPPPRPAATLE